MTPSVWRVETVDLATRDGRVGSISFGGSRNRRRGVHHDNCFLYLILLDRLRCILSRWSGPYSRRLDRVPYLALAGFAVTVALLYYLSARYPEADVFGFAFPAFILGLASRFGVASFRESSCERSVSP